MPQNVPYGEKHVAAIEYAKRINQPTEAEKQLEADTQALHQTMSPMTGAKDQHISFMQISPGEAHLISSIVRDLGRQTKEPILAVDLGTFTGHSAGAIARGMDENGGTVISVDDSTANNKAWNPEFATVAKKYWAAEKDSQGESIESRIKYDLRGSAAVLDELLANTENHGKYDLFFIDEAKFNYEKDVEKALTLLRPGGKILLDNMLWSGRVADPNAHDANTDTIRELNEKLSKDSRINYTLLEGEDGLGIIEKKGYRENIIERAAKAFASRGVRSPGE